MSTIILISGVIGWDVTPDDVRNQLSKATGDIVVEIASPGGGVWDGLEIFSLINSYTKGKKTSKITGIAASMASVIALSCDKVTALDTSVYMIHNAINFSYGNHNDMREMADHLEKVSNHIASVYVKKTSKSLEEIKTLMDADTYLFGNEMKEMGFIDEIIETQEKDLSKDSAIVKAQLDMTNCTNTLKELENSKDDLKKAVASLQNINEPVKTEIKNKLETKEKIMGLKELLAENQAAQAEYNEAIKAAEKKGADKTQATAQKAASFMTAVYPQKIHEKAIAVIKNEADIVVLEAMAGMVDTVAEQAKIDAAIKETADLGDTKPELKKTESNTGVIDSEEALLAEIKNQGGK